MSPPGFKYLVTEQLGEASGGPQRGIVSVFTLTHTTWRDSNRNGVPDPGEVTANVSRFRVKCP